MKISKAGKTSEVDMISNLPDPILDLILSRVPTTKEVARTSILSKRWRNLWTTVSSIDIDYFRVFKPPRELYDSQFEEFVCRVLANKLNDLQSFRLSCLSYYNMPTMWQWIDDAIRRNVKILDLSFRPEKHNEDIELPYSLVTCRSLEVLRLSLYARRLMMPKVTGFSALRVLGLKSCKLPKGNLLEDFFKSCPLLEDLSLVDCMTYELDLFCISCPKLKKLGIHNLKILSYSEKWDYGLTGMCKRLQICCPKLVSLEFVGFMAREFIFESLDSLKNVVIGPLNTYKGADRNLCALFAEISHVESLSLHICLIRKFINLGDLPEPLPNLKTLGLITANDAFNINVLIQIIIRSSNLESLHLTIQKGPLYVWYPRKDHDLNLWEMNYDCIFERLKMVKMTGIYTVPHHMGFIEFVLKRSPSLETMSITPFLNKIDGRLSLLTDGVLKFPRASPQAEIIFVQDQM